MRTTILLLSVDEAPLLAYSLPAAVRAAARAGAPVDVVVVDNGSSDETSALAAEHGARHLRFEPRRSYAGAINEAVAQTGGDAVLLLNADCALDDGFLAAALPRLAAPRVGSVAPKLLRMRAPGAPLEEIDAAGMYVDHHRKNGLVGHGRPAAAFATPAAAFGADGAAALYRRETLLDCALDGREVLDEDFQLWASDADLAWRARLLGWECAYEPAAVGHHVRTYSPSTRAALPERSRRMQFRNRLLMIVKNETRRGLRRDGALIAGYELLALGHVLLRERHLLGGYRDAWRLLGGARRRRAQIQSRRRVDLPPFGLRPPA
ncbi:MAG TPA: glycosyltransferase [Solirubrobacteraceae bacterium]|nr:glycosyltransferase [Solirubrobacteraceae bacterium]